MRGTIEIQKSAALDYNEKMTDAANDWTDLQYRFTDAKQRLALVKDVELLQELKWKAETSRHQKGRSTMLQVLNSEQDYANARLMRVRIKGEILTLSAQMKLFRS